MNSETSSCRFCSTPSSFLLSAQDFNRKISKFNFDYYICPNCKLVFLSNIPNDLSNYYSTEYYHFPFSKEEMAKLSIHEEYKVDIVREFTQSGRLLDIGPSVGGFLYRAKHAGFDVEALEMDPACCYFMQQVLKIPTIQSSDIVKSLNQKKYEIITLWQVIEHLENPWESLRAIVKALNPGGFLVISAPNPDALQFKIFKNRWTHLDAPRHLQLYPVPLLKQFIESLGMTLCSCKMNDVGGLGWNVFGWKFSLSSIHSTSRFSRCLRFLGKILSVIFSPLERREGLGSSYTLIFNKKGLS